MLTGQSVLNADQIKRKEIYEPPGRMPTAAARGGKRKLRSSVQTSST